MMSFMMHGLMATMNGRQNADGCNLTYLAGGRGSQEDLARKRPAPENPQPVAAPGSPQPVAAAGSPQPVGDEGGESDAEGGPPQPGAAAPPQPVGAEQEPASAHCIRLSPGAAADAIGEAIAQGKANKRQRREEAAAVPPTQPVPKCPSSGGSVKYRGAVITSKDDKNKFRLFVSAKCKGGLDVDRSWKTSSKADAYKKAIEKIDQFWG